MRMFRLLTVLGTSLLSQHSWASDTVHLDIAILDDGTVAVRPGPPSPAISETIKLGQCTQTQEPRKKSMPFLANMPISTKFPKPLEEMTLEELKAVSTDPNMESDLRIQAFNYFEGLQLLLEIREAAAQYDGRTLMDRSKSDDIETDETC